MKKLMKKMQKQADQAEPTDAHKALICERLDEVFEDHSLDKKKMEGFYNDLLAWKSRI